MILEMNKKVIFLDNTPLQILWKHQHHIDFSPPSTAKFLHPDGSTCELTDFTCINSLQKGGETDERSNDTRSTKTV